MKKILLASAVATLVLAACGNEETKTEEPAKTEQAETTEQPNVQTTTDEPVATIVIPDKFLSDGGKSSELDDRKIEHMKVTDNHTVFTITLSNIEAMKSNILGELDVLFTSAELSEDNAVTKLAYNEDLSEIEILVDEKKFSNADKEFPLIITNTVATYQILNGTEEPHSTITFLDEKTKKELYKTEIK